MREQARKLHIRARNIEIDSLLRLNKLERLARDSAFFGLKELHAVVDIAFLYVLDARCAAVDALAFARGGKRF